MLSGYRKHTPRSVNSPDKSGYDGRGSGKSD